jgi:hypothetical protein
VEGSHCTHRDLEESGGWPLSGRPVESGRRRSRRFGRPRGVSSKPSSSTRSNRIATGSSIRPIIRAIAWRAPCGSRRFRPDGTRHLRHYCRLRRLARAAATQGSCRQRQRIRSRQDFSHSPWQRSIRSPRTSFPSLLKTIWRKLCDLVENEPAPLQNDRSDACPGNAVRAGNGQLDTTGLVAARGSRPAASSICRRSRPPHVRPHPRPQLCLLQQAGLAGQDGSGFRRHRRKCS